jgi:hypothetical protein
MELRGGTIREAPSTRPARPARATSPKRTPQPSSLVQGKEADMSLFNLSGDQPVARQGGTRSGAPIAIGAPLASGAAQAEGGRKTWAFGRRLLQAFDRTALTLGAGAIGHPSGAGAVVSMLEWSDGSNAGRRGTDR